MKPLLFMMLLAFLPTTMAIADIEQQSLQFCEKMKLCALQGLDGQELSADMKTMVTSSMDAICDEMVKEFNDEEFKGDEELHQQASACLDSLSSLSCTALMNDEVDTPACQTLEKTTAKYQ